jgi:hypothetical protein
MSEDRHDISICKDKAFLGGPCADLLCVHRDELLNETLHDANPDDRMSIWQS